MKYLSNKTDSEIIKEAKTLFDLIFVSECFRTKDLQWYGLMCKELEARGFEIKEEKKLVVKNLGGKK